MQPRENMLRVGASILFLSIALRTLRRLARLLGAAAKLLDRGRVLQEREHHRNPRWIGEQTELRRQRVVPRGLGLQASQLRFAHEGQRPSYLPLAEDSL